MAKQPTNLGQGIPRLGGELITRLNNVDPGLGTLLASEINYRTGILNSRVAAAAGHAGTVVIAPQKRTSSGSKPPAMKIQGTVVGEGAQSGDEFVTLAQVRSLFTCDRFAGHPSGFPGWFEDCVEQEAAVARVAAAGEMPYFFGWTFHPPNASDVLTADPITNGTVELFSTLVPEGTGALTQVSYGLTAFNPIFNVFGDGPAGMNIGLYDSDLNLLTETGLIAVLDGGVDQITGFFATPLLTEVSLPAGEYFQAYASNCCMRMYVIADSAPVTDVMQADATGIGSNLGPGLHFGKAWSPASTIPATSSEFVRAMPTSIDRDGLKRLDNENVPMVMYG